jgi:hypothetical protein
MELQCTIENDERQVKNIAVVFSLHTTHRLGKVMVSPSLR